MRIAAWLAAAALAANLAACGQSGQSQVERGKYLVQTLGCSDCHTPGGMSPRPDLSRYLAGSDVDFVMPGLGVFTPNNLTPDKATGLGAWSSADIVKALTTGVTPTGRILAPAMPWASSFTHLTHDDAEAIAAYLKSLPAVSRPIPAPRGPRACVAGAVMCMVAREAPRS